MPARKRAKAKEAPPQAAPLVLNGWTFVAWPDFDERWRALITTVAAQRVASPTGPLSTPEATVLAALVRLLRDHIARDPNAADYRLKANLSAWRRVKFLGRLRLFYRFSSAHQLVVLTWLNDENTLRKDGATSDPYQVFAGMLSRGEVPETWGALVAGAKTLHAPLPDKGR